MRSKSLSCILLYMFWILNYMNILTIQKIKSKKHRWFEKVWVIRLKTEAIEKWPCPWGRLSLFRTHPPPAPELSPLLGQISQLTKTGPKLQITHNFNASGYKDGTEQVLMLWHASAHSILDRNQNAIHHFTVYSLQPCSLNSLCRIVKSTTEV